MKGDGAKITVNEPESSVQYSLFAKSLTLTADRPVSSVRETESTYAVSKIRTLSEGVDDERLSVRVRKIIANIQAIDSDGYLFAGDPVTLCGNVAGDETRPQCLLWIPGRGKQLLESVETWMHVASSRLGQKLDQETAWFDAIRTVAVQAVSQNVLLATADGTTADPFICRVGKLFRIPVLRFAVLPKVLERKWIQRQVQNAVDADTLRLCKPSLAFFSWLPRRDDSVGENSKRRRVKRSDADGLLAAMATTQVLVSVRSGGNVFKSANRRLADRQGLATRVLLDGELTKPSVSERLLDAGAVGWRLLPPKLKAVSEPPKKETSNNESTTTESSQVAERLDFSDVCDRDYLIHWTRRRMGPWPDLTHDDYLDDLLFRSGRRRQNELAALCRILASRALFSTADLTRDPRPVICFSRMRLSELITKRVFRSHLSRWDFEPFGIAFSPAMLQDKFGASPVIYGDESKWNRLDDSARPYFQLQNSASGQIDWRQEKEWRTLGDVDLNQIAADEAIVFVGREADADWVRQISVWPVVVLPQSSSNVNGLTDAGGSTSQQK